MKTELRIAPHQFSPDAQVFEIWYNDTFIGQVVGADWPGVKVISKYPMQTRADNRPIPVVEVAIHHLR